MSLTTQDLKQISTLLREHTSGLATKDDLEHFATKEDLDRFATKTELDRMESRLILSIGLLEHDALTRLEDHELRLSRLERKEARA